MSRAYRIAVQESVSNVVRAEDHVSCQLELLGILPADQMAPLLAAELAKQGFQSDGQTAQREDGEVSVTVELKTGSVVVRSEKSERVKLEGAKHRLVYEEWGTKKQAEDELRSNLQEELRSQAESKRSDLQKQVTDALEARLGDLRAELEGAVNRATAEALKQRAAQLGKIKAISQDAEAGSLTIVVEV